MKNKAMSEAQFLAVLEKVLPKATKDPHLASKIYDQVEKEVRIQKDLVAFEKFCESGGRVALDGHGILHRESDARTAAVG